MRTIRVTAGTLMLLFAMLGLVACDGGGGGGAQPTAVVIEPTSTTPPTEEPTATTEAPVPGQFGEWATFTNEEGNFSVSMPGTPQENVHTSPSEIGELTFSSYGITGSDSGYTVSYVDYPEAIEAADPGNLLNSVVGGVVGSNTMGEVEEITVQGHPGRATEFTSEGTGYVRYRAILARSRLYQLITVAPDESTNVEDSERFFDSFRILDQ